MIVQFADLISGLFGLLAALLLGGPALTNLLNKKRWQQVKRLRSMFEGDDEGSVQVGKLRDHYLDRLVGPSRAETFVNVLGYLCLVFAFGFLLLAGFDRAFEHQNAPGVSSEEAQ